MLLENHQKLGERHGTDSLSQSSEGCNPADTLSWTSSFQNYSRINCCCLTAVFGNFLPTVANEYTKIIFELEPLHWLFLCLECSHNWSFHSWSFLSFQILAKGFPPPGGLPALPNLEQPPSYFISPPCFHFLLNIQHSLI